MYWPCALGVIGCVPIVMAGGVVGVGVRVVGVGWVSVVVLEPITSTGWMPVVCSSTGVEDAPEPRIRGVLAARVCPASM